MEWIHHSQFFFDIFGIFNKWLQSWLRQSSKLYLLKEIRLKRKKCKRSVYSGSFFIKDPWDHMRKNDQILALLNKGDDIIKPKCISDRFYGNDTLKRAHKILEFRSTRAPWMKYIPKKWRISHPNQPPFPSPKFRIRKYQRDAKRYFENNLMDGNGTNKIVRKKNTEITRL